MQRLRHRYYARGAGLLVAACLILAGRDAKAQSALVNPDPLAPKLATNPLNPPRFQKFTQAAPAPPGQPTFAPPRLICLIVQHEMEERPMM